MERSSVSEDKSLEHPEITVEVPKVRPQRLDCTEIINNESL